MLSDSDKSTKLLAGEDQEFENESFHYVVNSTTNSLSEPTSSSNSNLVTAVTNSTSVRYAPMRKNIPGFFFFLT